MSTMMRELQGTADPGDRGRSGREMLAIPGTSESLTTYAARWMGRHSILGEDAEDCWQRVALLVVRNGAEVLPEEEWIVRLKRMVRCRIVEAWRRKARQERWIGLCHATEEIDGSVDVTRRLAVLDVATILAMIRPDYRKVLELKIFHDMGSRALADQLGLASSGAARQLVWKAMASVREEASRLR